MRRLSLLPIEGYVLILPSLLLFFVFSSAEQGSLRALWGQTLSGELFARFLLPESLLLFAPALIYAYLVGRGIYAIGRASAAARAAGVPFSLRKFLSEGLPAIRSAIFICLLVSVPAVALTKTILHAFLAAPVEQTREISAALMQLDHSIFGSYPSLSLASLSNTNPLLDRALIGAYLALGSVLATLFMIMIFSGRERFRRFLLSFFFSVLIAVPFWQRWPAISPIDMYRHDILLSEIPADIAALAQQEVSPRYTEAELGLARLWIDPSARSLAISTNPSMHAAWAVAFVHAAWGVSPLLGAATALWSLGQMVGAVYLGQHYMIDILTGAVTGVFAILLAYILLRRDRRRFDDRFALFLLLDILEEDRRRIWEYSRVFIKKSFGGARATNL